MPKKRQAGWAVHEDPVSYNTMLLAISPKRKPSHKLPPAITPPPARDATGAHNYMHLDDHALPAVPLDTAPKVCVKKNCRTVLLGGDARFKYCPGCRAEQREWTRRAKERKERVKQLTQGWAQSEGSLGSEDDGPGAMQAVRPSKEELWRRMGPQERLVEWMQQVRASGTLQSGTDIVLGRRKVGAGPDGSAAVKRTKADNVYPEYLSAMELAAAMSQCIANAAPRPTGFKGCFCVVQSTSEHVTRVRLLDEADDMWVLVFGASRHLGPPSVSSFKANGHNGRRADYDCVCSPGKSCGGTLTIKVLKVFGDVFPGEKIIVKMTHS